MERLGYPASWRRAATRLPGHRRDGSLGTRRADRHPHHTNLLTPALGDAEALSESPPTTKNVPPSTRSPNSMRPALGTSWSRRTRPETIGYALLDSPIALAAWMIDHDTDSYEKIARGFVDGQPSGNLTREHIVDNITLYWLTSTGASAGTLVLGRRTRGNARAAGQAPRPVSIPVGFTTFPGRSGTPRAAGSRRRTPTSSTSTRWTRAVTSPLGRNRSSSRKSCRAAFRPLRSPTLVD